MNAEPIITRAPDGSRRPLPKVRHWSEFMSPFGATNIMPDLGSFEDDAREIRRLWARYKEAQP